MGQPGPADPGSSVVKGLYWAGARRGYRFGLLKLEHSAVTHVSDPPGNGRPTAL